MTWIWDLDLGLGIGLGLDNCFLIGGDFLTEISASKTLKWMTVGKLYPKKDRDVRTL